MKIFFGTLLIIGCVNDIFCLHKEHKAKPSDAQDGEAKHELEPTPLQRNLQISKLDMRCLPSPRFRKDQQTSTRAMRFSQLTSEITLGNDLSDDDGGRKEPSSTERRFDASQVSRYLFDAHTTSLYQGQQAKRKHNNVSSLVALAQKYQEEMQFRNASSSYLASLDSMDKPSHPDDEQTLATLKLLYQMSTYASQGRGPRWTLEREGSNIRGENVRQLKKGAHDEIQKGDELFQRADAASKKIERWQESQKKQAEPQSNDDKEQLAGAMEKLFKKELFFYRKCRDHNEVALDYYTQAYGCAKTKQDCEDLAKAIEETKNFMGEVDEKIENSAAFEFGQDRFRQADARMADEKVKYLQFITGLLKDDLSNKAYYIAKNQENDKKNKKTLKKDKKAVREAIKIIIERNKKDEREPESDHDKESGSDIKNWDPHTASKFKDYQEHVAVIGLYIKALEDHKKEKKAKIFCKLLRK